jgi:hypothetical protein
MKLDVEVEEEVNGRKIKRRKKRKRASKGQ